MRKRITAVRLVTAIVILYNEAIIMLLCIIIEELQ